MCVLCFRGGVSLAADAAAEFCEADDDEGGLRCVQGPGVLLQSDVSDRRPPVLSGRLQPRRLLRRLHPEPEHGERRCVTVETDQQQMVSFLSFILMPPLPRPPQGLCSVVGSERPLCWCVTNRTGMSQDKDRPIEAVGRGLHTTQRRRNLCWTLEERSLRSVKNNNTLKKTVCLLDWLIDFC